LSQTKTLKLFTAAKERNGHIFTRNTFTTLFVTENEAYNAGDQQKFAKILLPKTFGKISEPLGQRKDKKETSDCAN
jgi:hypothetical protein